ncbi:MAG: hypothetical protein Q8858_17150, partial [Bacteroidota bacterium]|nr:hypothetical protein [Bacteroidota bacterium]
MKKLMTVLIAILFLLSTTAFCFAQGSKAQPEATPPVREKDKMTAPLVSKEELQKRKEQQAEQKKARKA